MENALSKVKDEKGLKRVARFLKEGPCPDCAGTRLSKRARQSTIGGLNLADVTRMTLDDLIAWLPTVPSSLPDGVREMASAIIDEMTEPASRLKQLGLGYLSLDRASSTLSTGERQRVQLARAVRNRTTGILYVLDEPSIGLHPSNVDGLLQVIDDLVEDGNSVVCVDHDVRVVRQADHLIEIGPGSGDAGGTVIAQGTPAEVGCDSASRIGGFLTGAEKVRTRERCAEEALFDAGAIELHTRPLHTVHALDLSIPRNRLTCVTGVSGSGKTTLVLESLVPALQASSAGEKLPDHVKSVSAPGIARADLIDATPIGVNVRSTVATYCGVLDDLRRAFGALPRAKELGLKAGDFSYNTGSLRCPGCDGTGQIVLDVQFLPDVNIVCPDCHGSRYGADASSVRIGGDGTGETGLPLPELMAMTVDQAATALSGVKGRGMNKVREKLSVLSELGLGYLTLGEATPALSGGEAQRLKLASEIGRDQSDTLFVFDEPTIGLHPLDVQVLLGVLQRLLDSGATVLVIEHDLDMIANADYLVDMGPGGGVFGGRIVAQGTPEQVAANPESVTGHYVKEVL